MSTLGSVVIIGLSITSSWGNGHATTYRSLARALAARGHPVTFLERDVPWYAGNRDLPKPPYASTCLYGDLYDLRSRFDATVRDADLVIVGSFVPDGIEVGNWACDVASGVVAFYDIDTPVTVARLGRGEAEYLSPELVSRYDLYLSFTGGPMLGRLEREFGARMARPLYCSVDPLLYYPTGVPAKWDLGYLGTYGEDRQRKLDDLLIEPARRWTAGRFVVAGPQYPPGIAWPANVERIEHLPPDRHRDFYNEQRYTLNITRADMVAAGWSPSVRLFEAAACATPIISDRWAGLEALFTPGKEILIVDDPAASLDHLRRIPEAERLAIGHAGRQRVLEEHTSEHRARELELHFAEASARRRQDSGAASRSVLETSRRRAESRASH